MGVGVEEPTSLQNIAIWDYWQNADWAEEIGVGGTRVQVMSVGYGWIWFIPLGPNRTSVGLVVPASYYRTSGLRPADLYAKALAEEERISALMKNAVSEEKLQTTKDWSFVAERHSGENWLLVGESSGFADPILAAGMNIAQAAAREAAFTILELERGTDPRWLRQAYDQRVDRRIRNHVRFADFWYTANAQFTDLKEFTRGLAEENGLDLSPEASWAWLSQGGFIDEDLTIGTAGFSLSAVKGLGKFLNELEPDSPMFRNNVFTLNLEGAVKEDRAHYHEGRVLKDPCYRRGDKVLPIRDVFEVWLTILRRESKIPGINREIATMARHFAGNPAFKEQILNKLVIGMEALISDGWVNVRYQPGLPLLPKPPENRAVHWHEEVAGSPEAR
jgi:hypothetical protein